MLFPPPSKVSDEVPPAPLLIEYYDVLKPLNGKMTETEALLVIHLMIMTLRDGFGDDEGKVGLSNLTSRS